MFNGVPYGFRVMHVVVATPCVPSRLIADRVHIDVALGGLCQVKDRDARLEARQLAAFVILREMNKHTREPIKRICALSSISHMRSCDA